MKSVGSSWKYVEPMWVGKDGQISIRRFLALIFSFDFVNNMNYTVHQWGADKSYSEAAMLLGIEAGLIAALLSLTTYSTIVSNKIESENKTPSLE